MILGILGGVFGLAGTFFAMTALAVVGGISTAFQNSTEAAATASKTAAVSGQLWIAVLAAVVGLAGAVIVRTDAKKGGWLMLASAVVGLFTAGLFYILGALCSGLAGGLALLKKEEKEKAEKPAQKP